VRQLLKTYVDQRINFYLGTDRADRTAGSDPVKVQNDLWSTVVRSALPTKPKWAVTRSSLMMTKLSSCWGPRLSGREINVPLQGAMVSNAPISIRF
jgi:hypothetical protein